MAAVAGTGSGSGVSNQSPSLVSSIASLTTIEETKCCDIVQRLRIDHTSVMQPLPVDMWRQSTQQWHRALAWQAAIVPVSPFDRLTGHILSYPIISLFAHPTH
jgi:hypothetical protein